MNNSCDDSIDITSLWTKEYKTLGIPSSFRKEPARVVTEFISWLKKEKRDLKTAADLGCGRGRNSFYLAKNDFSVKAIDLVPDNADFINEQAKLMNLSIEAFAQDVSHPWPIASNSLDIAIDIFCYKHITNKQAQKNYRNELFRTLKSDGYYFISLASLDDGFYGQFLETSLSPNDNLIVDPYAKIQSYLYSKAGLESEFADQFSLVNAVEQTTTSPMHGKEYTRKVLNFIFKKI